MDGDRGRFCFFFFGSFAALDCIHVLYLVLIFWLMIYLF